MSVVVRSRPFVVIACAIAGSAAGLRAASAQEMNPSAAEEPLPTAATPPEDVPPVVPAPLAGTPPAPAPPRIDPEEPEAPSPFASDPAPARAMDDAAGFHLELGARGAYVSPPVRGGSTPFGFGAGGGLDFVFAHVMIGASVLAFRGTSSDDGSAETAILYGAEAGYELRPLPWLSLRPMLALGGAAVTSTNPIAASTTTTTTTPVGRRTTPVDVVTQASSISTGGGSLATTTSTVVNALYAAPGILATAALSPGTFVGVGGRVLYFPSVSYSYDSSAAWMAYSLDVALSLRF
jgi:hypothetical protein